MATSVRAPTKSALLRSLRSAANKPMEKAVGNQPALYWHQDIAALEHERIFKQDWYCAGLAAQIPKAGDYFTFSLAGEPVYCIRDKAGVINTQSNVCRHRMMQLLEGEGNSTRVVCPYHAWTYDLQGQLVGAGYMDRSKGFDKKSICLPGFKTEVWHGWIYVTLNPDATPVADTLSELAPVLQRYGMEHYVPVLQERHTWQTNWKLIVENFMEGYHLPVAHRQTVGAWFSPEATQFPDHVHPGFTWQSFLKSGDAIYGQAHPDNTTLDGEWRNRSVMPTVFPTHMYVLAPDHLWYLSLTPVNVGQVDVQFGVAIAPEVDQSLDTDAKRSKWLGELVSFFDRVNNEDRELVEGIYRGSHSKEAKAGRLSWLERELHDFQRYLANALTPA